MRRIPPHVSWDRFVKPSLHELQQAFAAAIFAEEKTVLSYIASDVFPAADRLQVYRDNIFARLTEALIAVYPVVRRIVGEDFFEYAAKEFILRYPPISGNLHDFGEEFAEFLDAFASVRTLVYLRDVARLEWAWHRAFHAADVSACFLEQRLDTIAPALYEKLVFELHPSVGLLASDYPVMNIWQVNQPHSDCDAMVNLNQGPDHLLIMRRRLSVIVEPLGTSDYALLCAFAESKPLAQATEVAYLEDPAFDLQQALYQHISSGAIVGFRIYGTAT